MPTDPKDIRALILDVDGVMTDASIIYSTSGEELKAFNTRDGFGIRLYQHTGRKVAIITGRGGAMVRRRAEELGITTVIERSPNKAEALHEVSEALSVEPAQMAYLGDDWPDLPAMTLVGYPIATADAEPEVRDIARYVTDRSGGKGAVRDAVNHLLAQAGELDDNLRRFMGREPPVG